LTHAGCVASGVVTDLHVARFADLDTPTVYALIRLRVDVFVVEQECPYPELDGRDLEVDTRHVWIATHRGPPAAYLRVLADPDGSARIGRVCVARDQRGRGHAHRLMPAALDLVGDRRCALDAQSYLVDFYLGYGFEPTGPEYLDDGIPHVPMARPATQRLVGGPVRRAGIKPDRPERRAGRPTLPRPATADP